MDEIQSLFQTADVFAVIERIQREGTPLEIAARYQTLVTDLYWKAHDLSAVVNIGRAAILYCVAQPTSPETEKLRSIAKAIAFNLGSFTWPGWEEPGITPTAADLAFGMDCAKLNRRLAIELKKPAKAMSNAHWLVGAHALAAGNAVLAGQEFQRAHDVLDASERTIQLMNLGFLAVAELSARFDDQKGSGRFDEVANELRAIGDDDSKSFLAQIETARRLFVRR